MTGQNLMSDHPIAKDTLLAPDFIPGASSVICGRGRDHYDHVGNKNFRALLAERRGEYLRAANRTTKSMIVVDLVRYFRSEFQQERNRLNSLGAFVRKDRKTGRWYDVGDACAREKVGHTLRDPERTKDSNECRRSALRRSRSPNQTPFTTTKPESEPEHFATAKPNFDFIEQRQTSLFSIMMQSEKIFSSCENCTELPNQKQLGKEFDPSPIIRDLAGNWRFKNEITYDDEFGIFSDVDPIDLSIDGIEL
mmetsp:Transcript_14076/g.20611  ORF Transcript_14076/g.20611 Transcript_14076/m.20611 type:complete len:251 (-) Transcript_14076:48-800(-)|eukprot:CAMPEP_0194046394 /NCGR_PEP_ID=MMETSP0009_2-20130614/21074_1 /TAXON_ID=210454 /ORGANISM="Grammatophora oceanica, Strain CCMP 410" /LENGTH=250 /DNA_ID=CAMNT_0038691661 /DNA_START=55 /DNA_END=807 /DNA_ORIENTATION=-